MSTAKKPKKKLDEQAVAPTATPTQATSKAWMMANVVDGMMKMAPADLLPYFEQWQAMIGKEADAIPDGTADKNLATVNSAGVAVTEELKEILETETLSEETKERASVLFEAAVSTRVAFLQAKLEEDNEKRLDEEIDKINSTVLGQIDQYLTYVAEQWVKENKVQVKRTIKTELAESLIRDLHKVLVEHNIDIPADKVDAIEALSEEVKELRQKLNDQINENISVSKQLQDFRKEEVIKQETDGLALTQVEKVRKLAEGIDVGSDMEVFRKKVKILKESQTGAKTPRKDEVPPQEVIEEETKIPGKTDVRDMKSLAQFISRSVNK